MKIDKQLKRYMRHRRVRAKITGTSSTPRLCVFRSNKHIYGQLIDDENKKTLAAASDTEAKPKIKGKKIEIANRVGELLAKKALGKNIEKVVFDRGGYKYHGRIKSLAEGARKGGLKF